VGLLRYLRGTDIIENSRTENRALPTPENELPLLGAYTASPITPTAALAIADVWSAVRVLADAASSLPLHVYRRTATGRERVTSGKLVDLLDRPGPGTSQADLISSLMAHLAIWGNATSASTVAKARWPSSDYWPRSGFAPSSRTAGCAGATRRDVRPPGS
jgi:phage portal protein BeeE